MKFIALITFIFCSFTMATSWAAPYRRLVNFEWEAIEGAKSYEIELKLDRSNNPGQETKVFNFKVKDAAWNGRLMPGKYMMKLRSRDYRGVPGDWSEESEFNVGLDTAVLQFPPARAQFKSDANKEMPVAFKWAPVGGADEYQFELTSEDGKTIKSEKLTKPEIKVDVPVASHYTWKVSSSNKEGITSEATSLGQFTVLGKAVPTVKLEKPESEFVREIRWSRPDSVTSYDVFVFKMNTTSKKWEKFKTFENYQDNALPFDEQWPGGSYQVAIRGKAPLRPSSTVAKERFSVRTGDRSPAAEYTALVRKSIDRVTGWYAIASYLVTEMQFAGVNPEKNSSVAYKALGGTGRLGAGWMSDKTPWGFVGIVDMSGFTFNGKTQTFASVEANAIYRISSSDRGEVRLQAGPYFKELPETIADPFTNESEDSKITAMGPHLGAEYWYSLTPKLGIQLNAHVYMSVIGLSTPNGGELSPSMSTQFGFLGSYRFTRNFTGLIGYARREDKMSYKAVPSTSNFAVDGDENESTITGNYLNLFAEWSF